MSTRKHIPLKVQLAAALLQLVDAKGERLIPYAHSKMMTATQIVSLFELDHFPFRVADGGTSDPWNLTWRLRAEHKRKTATIDQPELGKQRRIRTKMQEHQEALYRKTHREVMSMIVHSRKIKQKIPSRAFSKGRKFAKRA